MENKQEICNALCATLKLTREYSDIKDITVSKDEEKATVRFEEGTKVAWIAMDSGSAMIRDIMKAIR